jgi:hypothetical protein
VSLSLSLSYFTCLFLYRLLSISSLSITTFSFSLSQNVIIWGNHSSTQYPDVNHAHFVVGGKKTSVRAHIKDDKYLNDEFLKTVQVQ